MEGYSAQKDRRTINDTGSERENDCGEGVGYIWRGIPLRKTGEQ